MHTNNLPAPVADWLAGCAHWYGGVVDARVLAEAHRGERVLYAVETTDDSGWRDRSVVTDQGMCWQCPTGEGAALVAKLSAVLTRWAQDEEILPTLVRVIGTAAPSALVPLQRVRLGAVAYAHGMGRMRRGVVVSLTRTHAVVAYTTASNAGRVYRKSVARAEMVTDAAE